MHTNFWGEQITTLYPPSLSKAGPFTFESNIALKASKRKNSQKEIDALSNPYLKTSTQTFFCRKYPVSDPDPQ